ncbi:pentatricopeptide repeat-containing protein [Senna tora]|uniref:Pentatricopeptide repeat-containing protein n=1 Tax=Senna tora TaxID=362788 RepID=A0A834SD17_9FABA|nr:pentatricopeptide repeat-containing protein [Senna tora]
MSFHRLLHLSPSLSPSKAILVSGSLFHRTLTSIPSSSSSSKEPSLQSESTPSILTDEDLTKINLLIPRLCDSNQLATAVHLTATALLANPPLKSLSISVLIDSLASQPDMTQPMSLLTHLKYTPISYPYIRPLTLMLVTSYFNKYKYKEALKVFNWMQRPDSPCSPDEKMYRILIHGFSRKGFVLEGLKVFRAMVSAHIVPGCDCKEWVYRGLLRQARIKEAMELNDALCCVDGEDLKRIAMMVLDTRSFREATDSIFIRLTVEGLHANIWKATVRIEPPQNGIPLELGMLTFCTGRPSVVTTKPDGRICTSSAKSSAPLVTASIDAMSTGA